jgi:hypothetical protein
MPSWISLAVIVGCLGAAVAASVLRPARGPQSTAG